MYHDVMESSALPEGGVACAVAGTEEVALYRIDGRVYATTNICTHQYALMSEGYFDGKCIECPLHQGIFDVKTGEALEGPVSEPLKTFPVEERDGRIYVLVAA